MPIYTEFPTDLITNVHWRKKKKPGDGGGGGGGPGHLCGTYSYGVMMQNVGGNIVSAVPFGPHDAPPGDSEFVRPDVSAPLLPGCNIYDIHGDLIAVGAPWGQHASSILLSQSTISFTDLQLIELNGLYPYKISQNYYVSMVVGYYSTSYFIKTVLGGSGTASDVEWGLGFGLSAPATPDIILAGGSGSYEYVWGDAIHGGGAGDALIWWMGRRLFPTTMPWGATTELMGSALFTEGDWYTWEIQAICGDPITG